MPNQGSIEPSFARSWTLKFNRRAASPVSEPSPPTDDGGKPSPWAHGVFWPVVAWIAFAHLAVLAAPFFFTWKGLALAAFMAWLTGSIGVCLGYHRYLTHGSFCTFRPVRWLLALIGSLSGQGSAISWVADHRKHHAFSDQEGDPHSPRDGGFWSHILWLIPNYGTKHHEDIIKRYAADLVKDPVMRWLHVLFIPTQFLLGAAMLAVGWWVWDLRTGISFVVWGMFVRMVWMLHMTWFVNSATHMWGYRNFETDDDSRNLWWVGLLAYGEGWHNNHHASQRMARHGRKWWEIDVTYWAIVVLEKVKLVWNVVRDAPSAAAKA